MKKTSLFQRIMALVLAVMLSISNLTLGISAESDPYCGNTEHEHTAQCYTAPTEAEEISEETEVTEAAEETEETEATEAAEETEAVEETVADRLAAAATLQELHDTMMADPQAVYAMSAEELRGVQTHAQALFGALEAPTDDEQEYYELIVETIEALLSQVENVPEILVDTDHITIDGVVYPITDKETLVDADLALVRWDAVGNSTSDANSASRISGTFDGTTVYGYSSVYNEIYDQLLAVATAYRVSFGTSTVSSTTIYKLSVNSETGSITVKHTGTRTVTGRLIILADDTATLSTENAGVFHSMRQ